MMCKSGEWAMVLLFCATIAAGAVAGAALRSGFPSSIQAGSVYIADRVH